MDELAQSADPLLRTWKLVLAYDGADFHGWQVQPGWPTIQGEVQAALGRITGESPLPQGSGRTDAGVHALAQVASFQLRAPIPPENLHRALNRTLPGSIRILSAEMVPAAFHARHSALAKTYEYRIFRGEVCSPFEWPYVHHYPYPLDEDRMSRLAAVFHGEHDFTPFAASDDRDAEGKSKVRTVFSSTLERRGPRLIYGIRGSGFLKHMVRNIVGTLIEAGKGNVSDLSVLPAQSGQTAPAKGLFLVNVEY
jgi:tRNA pseudouridine38-40 synthase